MFVSLGIVSSGVDDVRAWPCVRVRCRDAALCGDDTMHDLRNKLGIERMAYGDDNDDGNKGRSSMRSSSRSGGGKIGCSVVVLVDADLLMMMHK